MSPDRRQAPQKNRRGRLDRTGLRPRLRCGRPTHPKSPRRKAPGEQGRDDVAKSGAEVPRLAGGPAGWLSVLIPGALFAYFTQFLPAVARGGAPVVGISWVPSLDVRLDMLVDGLSLTFALLITGIGTLVTLYSTRYLGNHPEYPRFVLYLNALYGGHAGPDAVGQPDFAVCVLGGHDPDLLPPDRLRQRQREIPPLGAAGAVSDRGGRARASGGVDPAGPSRGHLQPVGDPGDGRRDPGPSALHRDPDPDPRGCLHQIRAVPVPLSGCPTPWPRRRRFRPICTRPPW